MANIGNFTRDGDKFAGTINTLTLKATATIQPVNKPNDKAPDYRIFAAGAEIGAAWTKTSQTERPYLSVKLDDPSFAGSIYCRLIEMPNGKHRLLWSR